MGNRYKLTFEYDGGDFSGWQKQPDSRTVQGVIEQAFSTFYQNKTTITGQGRTDAGVHARAQVAHVNLPGLDSISRLHRAMAGLLPKDVALIKAQKVSDDFHARFHASSREYQYIVTERYSPLVRDYSWHAFKPISIDLLHECAKLVVGKHDFINYCIPPETKEMTTVCTIKKSRWIQESYKLIYEIEGDRFLRHLVRRLVGTMIRVSDGTYPIEKFKDLLFKDEVAQKGHSAPAKGLTLNRVVYP